MLDILNLAIIQHCCMCACICVYKLHMICLIQKLTFDARPTSMSTGVLRAMDEHATVTDMGVVSAIWSNRSRNKMGVLVQ